jgi:transcription elongation factor Spt5
LSENNTRTSLYAVKVTNGQERTVSLMLADKAKVESVPIMAILAPSELKGYIIIEAQTPHVVDELIRGMRHTRERVQGTVSPNEKLVLLGLILERRKLLSRYLKLHLLYLSLSTLTM